MGPNEWAELAIADLINLGGLLSCSIDSSQLSELLEGEREILSLRGFLGAIPS